MKKILILASIALFLGGCQISENDELVNNIISSEIESSSSIISTPFANTRKIKIYLNPSVQIHNMYYGNVCSEADAMNIVAKKAYTLLSQDTRFIVYINDNMKNLTNSVKESNSLKVDYHLALHSNAGGGSGTESYFMSDSSFAQSMLDSFVKYHSFPNRGVKNGNTLYELKNSKALNKCLIEFLYHDNKTESKFITQNYDLLAKSIYDVFDNIASNS